MRSRAENTLVSLEPRTPADYVLPLVMDKITGEPIAPWGALRSQVAVLGVHNAYNGFKPPSWANGGGYPNEGPNSSSIHGHDGTARIEVGSESQFGFGF